ncbi:hypothetical protein F3Y22_tig00001825pilonHSYRG00196 [Hibiscus syriacus]|uniref:VAN3-binding protein-like auxin canalisation domain-containing protein n=1 Tax=Hibiscus syriacus TaxID=106335 RepID=A0A6A3CYY9_HIBSY|nr:hypothetical protein F3Y22_tig00001825pilonHSYRG00196 [Hibiscus syriacus]
MHFRFTSNGKCQTVSLSSLASSCCVCWNLSEEVDKFETRQEASNIDENGSPRWLQLSCPLPETPTESMDYLARSWSLSAMELSKALANTHIPPSNAIDHDKSSSASSVGNIQRDHSSTTASRQSVLFPARSWSLSAMELSKALANTHIPPSNAIDHDKSSSASSVGNIQRDHSSTTASRQSVPFFSLSNLLSKNSMFSLSMCHHIYLPVTIIAVSVAGVAAAVAALAASNAMLPEMESTCIKTSSKVSTAITSAATLVASHCIEIAEDMGADHDQNLDSSQLCNDCKNKW